LLTLLGAHHIFHVSRIRVKGKKVKFSRYRPRWPRGWIEIYLCPFLTAALEGGELSAARPNCSLPPGKDTVPIVQEVGWAPGSVWTGGKSRPTGIRSPDRPARSKKKKKKKKEKKKKRKKKKKKRRRRKKKKKKERKKL
jgi:hypothetical protein